MQTVIVNGVRIAHETVGEGPPVLLLHGFASSAKRNWQEPRWFDTLTAARRKVVALDFRGHGASDKPNAPEAYGIDLMMADVIAVLDSVGVERVDLMGYSMGGRIGAALLADHPTRFTRGILAGVGIDLLGQRRESEQLAKGLETDHPEMILNPVARTFREFAVRGHNDLRALAACMRGLHRVVDAVQVRTIAVPVLVVVGDRDKLVGNPQALADLIPRSRLLWVPGKNHFTTVGARVFKEAAVRFLEQPV